MVTVCLHLAEISNIVCSENMLSNKAKKARLKSIEALCKLTKFEPNEMEFVMQLHLEACKDGMDEAVFKDQLHQLLNLTDENMLERIFKVFDADGDGVVGLEEWAVGLSTVLHGNLQDLTNYCFHVYDLNGNGLIAKEEIIYFLKDSFIQMEENEDTEEQVKVLAEALIKKMDSDKDGYISLDDFRKSVQMDVLMLEAFGPCLPHKNVSLKSAYNHLLPEHLDATK